MYHLSSNSDPVLDSKIFYGRERIFQNQKHYHTHAKPKMQFFHII